MTRIVIRCDGAAVPEIGTGHVVRCLTLARALTEAQVCRASQITFLMTGGGPFEVGPSLVKADGRFNLKTASPEELSPNSPLELASLRACRTDLAVLDRLATTAELVEGLRRSGPRVITLDDTGPGRDQADLAINAILSEVPPQPNVLSGFDYLILSGDDYRPRTVRDRVERLVASFGGYDHRHLAGLFLSVLPDLPFSGRVDLIVGRMEEADLSPLHGEVDRLNRQMGGRLGLHVRPGNFGELIGAADLAVVSGGLTIFELLARGLPTVSLPQYPHQLGTLKKLHHLGATVLASRDMVIDRKHLADQIGRLLIDRPWRQDLGQAAARVVDGQGLGRVVAAVVGLLTDRPEGKVVHDGP